MRQDAGYTHAALYLESKLYVAADKKEAKLIHPSFGVFIIYENPAFGILSATPYGVEYTEPFGFQRPG